MSSHTLPRLSPSAAYTTGMPSPSLSAAPPASSARAATALRHPAAVTVLVLGLHAAALWALQTGLLRRAVETVVPAEILVELWSPTPPAPQPQPTPQAQATPARPVPRKPVAPPPVPLAVATPTPAPAEALLPTPQEATKIVAPPPTAASGSEQKSLEKAPTTAATAPSPAPAPKVELPSSDADYLNNPKPAYPALSKRMGEQGRVVVRTLIGTDGRAQEAQVAQSSGFERLDQAALKAALQWRYVPGKRDGVPQAMWFNVPFTFQLQ